VGLRVVLANPLFCYTPTEGSYPLNLVELASFVQASGRHEVRVVDLNYETRHVLEPEARFEAAAAFLTGLKPDVLGFSCMTVHVPSLIKFVPIVRRCMSTVIVLGGLHATSRPGQMLCLSGADFVVRAEGEVTLLELLDALELGGELPAVRGIGFMQAGGLVLTPARRLARSLDSLPPTDFSLFDFQGYFNWMDGSDGLRDDRERFLSGVGARDSRTADPRELDRSFSVVASRGCPYHCVFCSTSSMWSYQRRKPIARVEMEIDHFVSAHDRRSISFEDDLLSGDRRWFLALMEMLERKGLDWTCLTRVDKLDLELIRRMAASGCRSVYHGIESGSARVRGVLGKRYTAGTTNDRVRAIVNAELEHGMHSTCSFMTGIPGESRDEMLQTIEFAGDLQELSALDARCFVQYWIMTPYPDTPAMSEFAEQLRPMDRWKKLRQGDVFRFEQYLLFGAALESAAEENPDRFVFMPDVPEDEFLNIHRAGQKLLKRDSYTENPIFLWDFLSHTPAGTFLTGFFETKQVSPLRPGGQPAEILHVVWSGDDETPLGTRLRAGAQLALKRMLVTILPGPHRDPANQGRIVEALNQAAAESVDLAIELTRPAPWLRAAGLDEAIRAPECCVDCLDLFSRDPLGRTRLCNGASYGPVEYMRSRHQLLELLEQSRQASPAGAPPCYEPRRNAAFFESGRLAPKLVDTGDDTLNLDLENLEFGTIRPVQRGCVVLDSPLVDLAALADAREGSRFLNVTPMPTGGSPSSEGLDPGQQYGLFQTVHRSWVRVSGAQLARLIEGEVAESSRGTGVGGDPGIQGVDIPHLVEQGVLRVARRGSHPSQPSTRMDTVAGIGGGLDG
jgi:anaerobic magnesium-protoporphyrin IX monomethyl ester cyclase